jgi:hypothetical protein
MNISHYSSLLKILECLHPPLPFTHTVLTQRERVESQRYRERERVRERERGREREMDLRQ